MLLRWIKSNNKDSNWELTEKLYFELSYLDVMKNFNKLSNMVEINSISIYYSMQISIYIKVDSY